MNAELIFAAVGQGGLIAAAPIFVALVTYIVMESFGDKERGEKS